MIILVGLGNPGKEYLTTRHNLGFLALDQLATALRSSAFKNSRRFLAELSSVTRDEQPILLAKPQTMMNHSGKSVGQLVSFYNLPLQNLWVIHDDLDLPLGSLRLSFDSRSAGHRGVQSIIDALGSKAFNRLRLGTANDDKEVLGAERFVLQSFPANELDMAMTTFTDFLPTFMKEFLDRP